MTDYKTNLIKAIRLSLEANAEKCIKAMNIIHSYQVNSEYQTGNVLYRNNMGFTPSDAQFLTSLCDWQSRGRTFSEKQLYYIKRLMPKYARQLFDHFVSNGRIRRHVGDSRYIANVESLFEKFEVPCPETANQPELFDEADAAYESERWSETVADDNNYFNFERYLADVSA